MYGILVAIVPTNIFTYATTDLSYVEQVHSTVDTPVMEDTPEDLLSVQSDESTSSFINEEIARKMDIATDEESTTSLVFGEELSKFNLAYKVDASDEELEVMFGSMNSAKSSDLSGHNIVEYGTDNDENSISTLATDQLHERIKEMPTSQSKALAEISNPDENYFGHVIILEDSDRDLLEHLVMGEAGNQGMIGAALVAQAIRDTMVYKGFDTVAEVRKALKYSGSISKEPNQDVKDAVAFIFDQGGYAVRHKVLYFYAPKIVNSTWHESQTFIIEYGGHRFFSN